MAGGACKRALAAHRERERIDVVLCHRSTSSHVHAQVRPTQWKRQKSLRTGDKMNKWPTEGPSFGHAALSREEKSNFKVRWLVFVKGISFVCACSHYQCWVVRAGVILFKSFHVLLPAYVDEDSRPARTLCQICRKYVRMNLMTISGFFRRISSFLHITWRSEHNTEIMWSTPKIFIMNLAADEEKLWLKWLVQRALEEIYEVRGFYRGLKLRYEPHAAAWPSAPREREWARAPYLSWLDLPPDMLARPFAYPLLSSGLHARLPLDITSEKVLTGAWKHNIWTAQRITSLCTSCTASVLTFSSSCFVRDSTKG